MCAQSHSGDNEVSLSINTLNYHDIYRYLPFFSITLGVLFFLLQEFLLLLDFLENDLFFYLEFFLFFAVFCSVIAGVNYIGIMKILFFQKNYFLLITIKVLKKESNLESSQSMDIL